MCHPWRRAGEREERSPRAACGRLAAAHAAASASSSVETAEVGDEVDTPGIAPTALQLGRKIRGLLDAASPAGFALVSGTGVLLDRRRSRFNGVVAVTRHGARWRVLRFGGDASEQGRSFAAEPGGVDADPCVLGYTYARTSVSAVAAFAPARAPGLPLRVVSVGLGTGALPAFLAGALGCEVEAVEIDPVVVDVCREVLGVALANGARAAVPEGGFRVFVEDAGRWFEGKARRARRGAGERAEAVLLDAYDADARVPPRLTKPAFLRAVSDTLVPGGCVVCNVFNGFAGDEARGSVAEFAGVLEAAVGPVYTVPAPAGTESANLVMVAVKDGGAPVSRRGLAARARAGFRRAPSRVGFDAGALVAGTLRARPSADAGAADPLDEAPPLGDTAPPWERKTSAMDRADVTSDWAQ